MSETAEREREIVAGVIGGITQKKADTWTIQVTPEGANFAKNLWTKDTELVESMSTKIGQHGAFVGSLGAPYTVQGKEVRSWWISSEADGTENLPEARATGSSVLVPEGAPVRIVNQGASDAMSKEEWRQKDDAADARALIAIAVSALTHTMPADPTPEDLEKFLSRVASLAGPWHESILSWREGRTPPF